MSKFYDSDMYGVTQQVILTCDAAANNDADDAVVAFKTFTAGKVVGANIVPTTVIGKSDTSGITIKHGTTSIGACVAGTGAALTGVSGTVTETNYAAGDTINLHTIVATETGVFNVAVSYQERYA